MTSEDWDIDPTHDPHEPTDEFLATVYNVPDGWWGFAAPDRIEHPGACVWYDTDRAEGSLLKGLGATSKQRHDRHYWFIRPTPSNGLTKLTKFELYPLPYRRHKLLLLHQPNRIRGRLDPDDLMTLQMELERLFPL